jgi:hypothetical protein
VTTHVAAGRTSREAPRRARGDLAQWRGSVTYIVVRTTSLEPSTARSSASAMIAEAQRACS